MFLDQSKIPSVILNRHHMYDSFLLIDPEYTDIVIDQQLSISFSSISTDIAFLMRLWKRIKRLKTLPYAIRLSPCRLRGVQLAGNVSKDLVQVSICKCM